jgi:hypothetical protein
MAEVVATSEDQNLRFFVRGRFVVEIQAALFLPAYELAFPEGVGVQDQY